MTTTWLNQSLQPRSFAKSCPRKDKRGVDLISDALPFGRLWYGEPNAVSNAIDYAKFYSRHIWHGEITFDNDRAL
jgi:hypothetical protein